MAPNNKNEIAALQAQMAALIAENEKLKAQKNSRRPTLKVSEKGAVSVYGLGRFPVTLYKAQMLTLLGMASEIQEFIKANDGKLSQEKAANHVQIVPPAQRNTDTVSTVTAPTLVTKAG